MNWLPRCPCCDAPAIHATPHNIGNPSNPSERRIVLSFICCGERWSAQGDFVVTVVKPASAKVRGGR